jgi:hypothetical protein
MRRLQAPTLRQLSRWGGVVLLGLALTACAGLQAYDLDQAVHHLAQSDAAARWGSPESVVALPGGTRSGSTRPGIAYSSALGA